MTLDSEGEDFIKSFEHLELEVYLDDAGHATIGWGHTAGVTLQTLPITEMEAEQFFEQDVAEAERVVRFVTVPLNQNEFNALVSFAYNEGGSRFLTSTLFKKLNLGDRRGAAKEFGKWIYVHDPKTLAPLASNGLKNRRQKEMALFLTPVQI